MFEENALDHPPRSVALWEKIGDVKIIITMAMRGDVRIRKKRHDPSSAFFVNAAAAADDDADDDYNMYYIRRTDKF